MITGKTFTWVITHFCSLARCSWRWFMVQIVDYSKIQMTVHLKAHTEGKVAPGKRNTGHQDDFIYQRVRHANRRDQFLLSRVRLARITGPDFSLRAHDEMSLLQTTGQLAWNSPTNGTGGLQWKSYMEGGTGVLSRGEGRELNVVAMWLTCHWDGRCTKQCMPFLEERQAKPSKATI